MVPKKPSWCALTLVLACAISGCVAPEGAPPPDEVRFYTDWADGAGHYVLFAPGAVPADLTVSVLEKETGVRQSFTLAELEEEAPGRYHVPATIRLKHGNTYLLEATSGDGTHGVREVRAAERSMKEAEREMEAHYDFTMERASDVPGERMAFTIDGTFELGTAPGTSWSRATGTGAMNASEDGMTMLLTLTEFEWADKDDQLTVYRMVGTGPWKMSGDPAGSGTVDFRGAFAGIEEKRGPDGTMHQTMKTVFQMDLTGTMVSEGYTFGFETIGRETEWSHLEDGTPFWVKGSETMTLTFPDGSLHTETESIDEPAGPEEAEPDLMEAVDFDGFVPTPWIVGDRVTLDGLGEDRITYHAHASGERQLEGQTVSVMMVSGTVAGSLGGGEEWVVIHDGPYAGLPLEWEAAYERGDERLSSTATLKRLL